MKKASSIRSLQDRINSAGSGVNKTKYGHALPPFFFLVFYSQGYGHGGMGSANVPQAHSSASTRPMCSPTSRDSPHRVVASFKNEEQTHKGDPTGIIGHFIFHNDAHFTYGHPQGIENDWT
jgi:hypothetical protein